MKLGLRLDEHRKHLISEGDVQLESLVVFAGQVEQAKAGPGKSNVSLHS